MHVELVFVILFAIATAVAIIARRLKIPYTAALVVAGLVLGSFGALDPPELTKELLFAVFLPALLFEAAFHIEFKDFAANKVTIVSMAVPGLIAAIVLSALILTPATNAMPFVHDFEFIHGLVLASLLAATDPIAVVGLFKTIGVPKRLSVLIEGESLLNDGAAVVVFTLILAVALGGDFSLDSALIEFVKVVGVGAGIGVAFGALVSWATHRIEDPMVEITLTTIAAYGSFVVAENLHCSGVIATVVAGMLCGNYGAKTGMGPATRVAVESFWEYMAFALNSIVFLLIGFEVSLADLAQSWLPILVAFTAVTLGRALVVFGVSGLLRRTREKIPWSWSVVLTWGGLRGGLSMVLVLTLASSFPHRDLLVTLTFGVVILSILGNGMTMSPLLRWLGVVKSHESYTVYETRRGELRAARAALLEITEMRQSGHTRPEILDGLTMTYQARATEAKAAINEIRLESTELHEEELLAASRQLLLVEKEAIFDAQRSGLIGGHAFEHLVNDVDARSVQLEEGRAQPEIPLAELERAIVEGATVEDERADIEDSAGADDVKSDDGPKG